MANEATSSGVIQEGRRSVLRVQSYAGPVCIQPSTTFSSDRQMSGLWDCFIRGRSTLLNNKQIKPSWEGISLYHSTLSSVSPCFLSFWPLILIIRINYIFFMGVISTSSEKQLRTSCAIEVTLKQLNFSFIKLGLLLGFFSWATPQTVASLPTR